MYFRVAAFVLAMATITTETCVDAVAGVCGLTLTCPRNTTATFRSCSANETEQFNLLALSLQTCQDISYFFNNGQPWPIDEKTLYCRVTTPCGSLVPFITSSNITTDMCDKFSQYANVIDTFHDLCRGEPVQNIVGDNGLLAELKANNGTRKPTPAPTVFTPSVENQDPSIGQVVRTSEAPASILWSFPLLIATSTALTSVL